MTAFITGGSSTLINDIHAFFQTWGLRSGTVGDEFNVESWNEGLGKSQFVLAKADAGFTWLDSEPIVENVHLEQSWVKDETMDITTVNVIQGGTVADRSFTMCKTIDVFSRTNGSNCRTVHEI